MKRLAAIVMSLSLLASACAAANQASAASGLAASSLASKADLGGVPRLAPRGARVGPWRSALSVGHCSRDAQRAVQHYHLLACASADHG
jgi:hypothetical protein